VRRVLDDVTKLKASDVMKTPVVTLDEEVLLPEAARILSDEHIGGAPVVDHRGEPLGVVSLFDIARELAGLGRPAEELGGFYRQGKLSFAEPEEGEIGTAPQPEGEATVGDIMAPGVIGVPAHATLGEVARLLWERQIHRVFVLDEAGGLLGVISTMDLLRVLVDGA
jgi:CBS domain-containing protein